MPAETLLPIADDLEPKVDLAANLTGSDFAPGVGRKGGFLRNSVFNAIRLGLTATVSILLPTFLTHRLPVKGYAAWVLILQMSAYVAYLNVGMQTAVAKYIAEYEAKRDWEGCGKCVSAGLRIMLFAGTAGMVLTVCVAFLLPRIFAEMPLDLIRDVRIGIVVVGASLSLGLVTSIFSAVFLGLQRYEVPMVISIVSRALYGAAVCAVVALHRGLIVMAIVTALINLLTSAAEIVAARRMVPEVGVRFGAVDPGMLRQMLSYCGILTVWSACMLFITGLDVSIVGHFAFAKVAYYSVANAPANMMLLLVGALLGPLLPIASALNVSASARHMGDLLLRTTRYSTVILLATALPLLVAGFPLLRVWVGHDYAVNSLLFLQVLLVSNVIRNLAAPYSTMVVAIAMQRVGTFAAIAEGVVNLACSILLAERYGALGVALGTFIGAFVGVGLHFAVTMHYTQSRFAISRWRLFAGGILRPAVMAIPTALLFSRWRFAGMPAMSAPVWLLWAGGTALLLWFVSLEREDRAAAARLVRTKLFQAPGLR